jgi:hypothetical protein
MRNTTLRTFTYTNPSCYPIEAALLREPNLWVPGKKPVGNVKIDKYHGFAPRLGCWLFGDYPNYIISLVDNKFSSIYNSDRICDVDSNGKYFYWATRSTQHKIYTTYLESTSGSYTFELIADWPATYDILRDTAGGSVYLFDILSDRFVIGFDPSTSNNIGFFDGDWASTGYQPCGNGYQHIIFVFNSTTGYATLYVNGIEKYSAATYSTRTLTSSTAKLFGRYSNDGNNYNPHNLKTYFYVIHDRALTSGEARDRYLDPYQFLIPA